MDTQIINLLLTCSTNINKQTGEGVHLRLIFIRLDMIGFGADQAGIIFTRFTADHDRNTLNYFLRNPTNPIDS
ncbi:hypothetical protein D3C81_1460880 [compost metagenome]